LNISFCTENEGQTRVETCMLFLNNKSLFYTWLHNIGSFGIFLFFNLYSSEPNVFIFTFFSPMIVRANFVPPHNKNERETDGGCTTVNKTVSLNFRANRTDSFRL